eukprot:TRINITY_DN45710_c1_g1_i1.p3 TRINITY_DN45710_c1_g1~~TRINITY_DN45710_c1_g1_i1.p3  ORF type:complete len:138 (+),score=9.82 TRINITY_DN45710_c1_g1_i1:56-415(+)
MRENCKTIQLHKNLLFTCVHKQKKYANINPNITSKHQIVLIILLIVSKTYNLRILFDGLGKKPIKTILRTKFTKQKLLTIIFLKLGTESPKLGNPHQKISQILSHKLQDVKIVQTHPTH